MLNKRNCLRIYLGAQGTFNPIPAVLSFLQARRSTRKTGRSAGIRRAARPDDTGGEEAGARRGHDSVGRGEFIIMFIDQFTRYIHMYFHIYPARRYRGGGRRRPA